MTLTDSILAGMALDDARHAAHPSLTLTGRHVGRLEGRHVSCAPVDLTSWATIRRCSPTADAVEASAERESSARAAFRRLVARYGFTVRSAVNA